MDKFHSILLYTSAHWTSILGYIAAALSALGTMRALVERFQGKTATEADHALGYLCDVLAFVARNGQRGVLGAINLPLWPSMPAKPAAPTQPARGSILLGVMLVIAIFGMLLAGCATPGGAALGKCELGSLPQATEPVIAAAGAILGNTSDINWVQDLSLLAPLAGGQINCIIAAITAAAMAQMPAHGEASPMLLTVIQRGQIWAKAHPAKCCAAGAK